MRKLLLGLVGVAALLAVPAADAAESWTMVSAYPGESFQSKNDQAFANGVTTATIGRVQVKLRAGGSLVPGPKIRAAVSEGLAAITHGSGKTQTVEMVPVQLGERVLSADWQVDPLLGFDAVPFLAGSYEAAQKLWQAAKPRVEALLAEQNLVLLYSVPWPPQGVFAVRPVDGADFGGLRLRSTDAATDLLAKVLGAQPEPLPVNELESGLADGTIEGFISSAATGYIGEIWNVAPYFYDLRGWLPRSYVFVNKGAWDALPATLQGLIRAEAQKAEDRGATDAKALTGWYLDQFRDHGMTVATPPAELQARLDAYGREQLAAWLERTGDAGRAIVERYRAM